MRHCCATTAVAASPAMPLTSLKQFWWQLSCFARTCVLGAAQRSEQATKHDPPVIVLQALLLPSCCHL